MAAGGQSSTWAAPGSHSGQVAVAATPSGGGDTPGEQGKLIAGREQQVGFGGASKVLLSVWGRTADSDEVEKQSVGSRSTEGDKGRPRGERQPPNRVQEVAFSEQE